MVLFLMNGGWLKLSQWFHGKKLDALEQGRLDNVRFPRVYRMVENGDEHRCLGDRPHTIASFFVHVTATPLYMPDRSLQSDTLSTVLYNETTQHASPSRVKE